MGMDEGCIFEEGLRWTSDCRFPGFFPAVDFETLRAFAGEESEAAGPRLRFCAGLCAGSFAGNLVAVLVAILAFRGVALVSAVARSSCCEMELAMQLVFEQSASRTALAGVQNCLSLRSVEVGEL